MADMPFTREKASAREGLDEKKEGVLPQAPSVSKGKHAL